MELDSQGPAHQFQLEEYISVTAVDVVAVKALDEALPAAVEASKGVGPVILGERCDFFPLIPQIDQLRRECTSCGRTRRCASALPA